MINESEQFGIYDDDVFIDGDIQRDYVVPPTPSPPPDLDGLTLSTNDMGDNDLIVSKENGGSAWVKKAASKVWDYIKTKLRISAQGSTRKYLNEQGEWTTPPNTTYAAMSSSELSTGTATTLRTMRADYAKDGIKQLMLDMCYPVGSIYISTKNVSPATFLGGTWKSLNGYMLRGATSGVTFNNNAKDGGADSVSVSSVASHNHTQDSHNHTQDAHSHSITSETALYVGGMNQNSVHKHSVRTEYGAPASASYPPNLSYTQLAGDSSGTKSWYNTMIDNTNTDHLHQVAAHDHYQNTGDKTATNQATTATNRAKGATYSISTLPNYKNVYMWERTA